MYLYKIKVLTFTIITLTSSYCFSQSSPNNINKDSSIIIKDNDLNLTAGHATSLLETLNFTQKKQLANDRSNLKRYLLSEFARKKMSKEAISLNLHTTPSVKQKILSAKQNILAQELIINKYKNIKINQDLNDLAREKYQLNIENYTSKEKIKVAHILFKTDQSDTNEAKNVRTKAEQVLERLKQGLDFSAAAKDFSEDLSNAKNGGIIDYFPMGRMVPSFDEAAFSLKKPGELSDIVETKFGYHIIKLLDRKSSVITPYENVKSSILTSIKKQLVEIEIDEYRKSFQANKNTTVFIPALDSLYKSMKNDLNSSSKLLYNSQSIN